VLGDGRSNLSDVLLARMALAKPEAQEKPTNGAATAAPAASSTC